MPNGFHSQISFGMWPDRLVRSLAVPVGPARVGGEHPKRTNHRGVVWRTSSVRASEDGAWMPWNHEQARGAASPRLGPAVSVADALLWRSEPGDGEGPPIYAGSWRQSGAACVAEKSRDQDLHICDRNHARLRKISTRDAASSAAGLSSRIVIVPRRYPKRLRPCRLLPQLRR